MTNLLIWFRATFLNYPYWQVYYKDGRHTYLLYWKEASGLRDVFNGKLKIPYRDIKKRYYNKTE